MANLLGNPTIPLIPCWLDQGGSGLPLPSTWTFHPQKGQVGQRPFGTRKISKVHPLGCQRLVVDRAGLRSFQFFLLVYFETDVTV